MLCPAERLAALPALTLTPILNELKLRSLAEQGLHVNNYCVHSHRFSYLVFSFSTHEVCIASATNCDP